MLLINLEEVLWECMVACEIVRILIRPIMNAWASGCSIHQSPVKFRALLICIRIVVSEESVAPRIKLWLACSVILIHVSELVKVVDLVVIRQLQPTLSEGILAWPLYFKLYLGYW